MDIPYAYQTMDEIKRGNIKLKTYKSKKDTNQLSILTRARMLARMHSHGQKR